MFGPAAITHGEIVVHERIDGVAVTEAYHPPGMEVALHAHPVPCLTYVVSGTFEERVDGSRHRCAPGAVILKPTDAAHTNLYGDTGARSFVVEVPGWIDEAFEDRGGPLSRCVVFEEGPVVVLAARIYGEYLDAEELSGLAVEELLHELVARVDGDAVESSGPAPGSRAPAWLRRVYDRLRAEFRRKPALSELAAEAGVHPDHVSRSFRRYFGSTISHQVRRWRVEEAARRIRAGDESLSAIALRAGFADQSHMTRQMKRHLGVTPGRLRER